MNRLADFLRSEVAQCRKADALGIVRKIEHGVALTAFERAAQELDRLEGVEHRYNQMLAAAQSAASSG